MTSLISRVARRPVESERSLALSFQQFVDYFKFGGLNYGVTGSGTLGSSQEAIGSSFQGYVEGAYKQNGIVFACVAARALIFSEARFQYQRMRGGRPGDLFGDPGLGILEVPWPNGTTGDLLMRALTDVDLAGNSYTARLSRDRLTRMRPDWVTIMLGSKRGDWEPGDLDTELIGYLYHPGGVNSGRDPVPLLPESVAHFAPLPDPSAAYRGMSWVTPVINEILGDKAAMEHKLRYFENGATVNLVATLPPEVKGEAFARWVEVFKAAHNSQANAYETVFLGAGADLKPVGSDMKQIDFKVVQGHGETRICAAARIPPIIVGLSEGLDSATYSNYGQARRAFADMTMRPLWRQMAGALATIVPWMGRDVRLWYDDRDVPFLQEDVKDDAVIKQTQAATIASLVSAGFTAESAILAVTNGDMNLLQHTGLVSVQLFEPGAGPSPAVAPAMNGANGRRLLEQFVGRTGT